MRAFYMIRKAFFMAQMDAFERGLQILSAWDEVSVFHGDDSWAQLDILMQSMKYRKIAVFTGCSSADKSGSWARLLAALRYTDCAVVRFRNIPAEPDMETVYAMKQFLEEEENLKAKK